MAAGLHRDGALVLDHIGLESQLEWSRVIQHPPSVRSHLVILVVNHLRDECLGLGGPGLSAGLAGGGPVARPARVLGVATQQLLESLLVLSVLKRVDERVHDRRHPGQDRGHHVEGGDLDVVVNDIDQHEGQETDQEGDEDGQHHLGEAEVLLPLGRGHAVLLGGGSRPGAVLLDVQSEKFTINIYLSLSERFTCSV